MKYRVISTIIILGLLLVGAFFYGAFDSKPSRSTSGGSSASDEAYRNVGR